MVRCKYCTTSTEVVTDESGFLSCFDCGRVVDSNIYSSEPTFTKNAGGQSQLSGTYVKSVQNELSESRERTLRKGRDEIQNLVTNLEVGGGDSIIDQAFIFYKIAVERHFTKGRRTSIVAASCLYIACRENKKAFLLIDFSEELRVNVYVLGAVFLELCKFLRLGQHPIIQKPVDPSLFIHRFTERLLGERNVEVSRTALRIVASMKRDWMQTGRKPSGLCGAALYISALSYGLKYSKSDIINVVHICEATLTKRLIEFENTESGSLTIEEFNSRAEELEREAHLRKPAPNDIIGSKASKTMDELLCEHKDTGVSHFAHGLCRSCYDDFITLSGGLQGGLEPPAFQRAEKERLARISPQESREELCQHRKEEQPSSKLSQEADQIESLDSRQLGSVDATDTHDREVDENNSTQPCGDEALDNMAAGESESLSDIDDMEVDGYLHNEEEKRYKKIIWEEMNKEYLEEQAAKEAAAAAAKEAYLANFEHGSEELLAAQELAAAAAAAVAKSKKERQQKRAAAKNTAPAQTAAEATRQILTKKRLSSKINYDVLEKLFADSEDPENTKRKRVDLDSGEDAIKQKHGTANHEQNADVRDDDREHEDEEYGEEDVRVTYDNEEYYGNGEDDAYGYDEDYGYEYE
ncbi:hypothetical protein Syun_020826 [Stephania yunnanensis]|uniref:Cyclin-like domain-containing protein n=1 Tax=Stephania yunnanensis TaxID=152371 RepID=A0AAP0IEH5_9MAGN